MTAWDTGWLAPALEALGQALVHFLWQGAVVGFATAAVLVLLPREAARVRYVTACLGLLVMFLWPALTLLDVLASPGLGRTSGASGLLRPAATPGAPVPLLPSAETLRAWAWRAWAVGVFLSALRLAHGWASVRALVARADQAQEAWREALVSAQRRLRLTRPVRLLESVTVDIPMVVGVLRPVLLVPASALTGLTPAQLEAILAHELAHIRRCDPLVNLVQAVVEVLLFYHPAVWWVSRRIREEREHCADDLAVSACGDVLLYVRALTRLEELRAPTHDAALGANGGSLLGRVRRLLAVQEAPARSAPSRIAGALAAALVALLAGVPQPEGAHAEAAARPTRSSPQLPERSPGPLASLEVRSSRRGIRTRPAETPAPRGEQGWRVSAEPVLTAALLGTSVPPEVPPGSPRVEAPHATSGVLPFDNDMTRPRLLSSAPLRLFLRPRAHTLTSDATQDLTHRSRQRGSVVARCVITAMGRVQDCEILKGTRVMNEAVLRALASRRYEPATYQGRPVSVRYVLNFQLAACVSSRSEGWQMGFDRCPMA